MNDWLIVGKEMREIDIYRTKKELFHYLEENGFERKLNSREPFTFSYIKRGNRFEFKFRFPVHEFNPAPMNILLYDRLFNLTCELMCSYDVYVGRRVDFLDFIRTQLMEKFKEYYEDCLNEDMQATKKNH
ncbi:MAG: hypothetical protein LUE98_11850 [Tannerellaceae bacterium]|nr:hypothetical protein [Tannerellaceae bacterium]